jgi:hypothetical protein
VVIPKIVGFSDRVFHSSGEVGSVEPEKILHRLRGDHFIGGDHEHDSGELTPDLFGDFNGIPKGVDKTEFYQHDQNWSNRMILGDSFQVMASLVSSLSASFQSQIGGARAVTHSATLQPRPASKPTRSAPAQQRRANSRGTNRPTNACDRH